MTNDNNSRFKREINTVIVDDEPSAIDQLKTLLDERGGINIMAEISDPDEAAGIILEKRPDLLFLDIQMSVKNGFEVLREISHAGFEPPVIFVTAFEQYAIEAIRYAAFDYILKPIEKQELYQALLRFAITYSHADLASSYRQLMDIIDEATVIRLPTESGYTVVNLDDIVYITTDWNYTRIFTGNEDSQLVISNIGSVQKRLPEGEFMRISDNSIINLKYLVRVRRIARKVVLEKDNVCYSIGTNIKNIPRLEQRLGSK